LVHDLEQLAPDRQIVATMAEKTQPDDLLTGNVLVLACATWNTGGSEGQLNPHMRALQEEKVRGWARQLVEASRQTGWS
jgi:hypothetical protein